MQRKNDSSLYAMMLKDTGIYLDDAIMAGILADSAVVASQTEALCSTLGDLPEYSPLLPSFEPLSPSGTRETSATDFPVSYSDSSAQGTATASDAGGIAPPNETFLSTPGALPADSPPLPSHWIFAPLSPSASTRGISATDFSFSYSDSFAQGTSTASDAEGVVWSAYSSLSHSMPSLSRHFEPLSPIADTESASATACSSSYLAPTSPQLPATRTSCTFFTPAGGHRTFSQYNVTAGDVETDTANKRPKTEERAAKKEVVKYTPEERAEVIRKFKLKKQSRLLKDADPAELPHQLQNRKDAANKCPRTEERSAKKEVVKYTPEERAEVIRKFKLKKQSRLLKDASPAELPHPFQNRKDYAKSRPRVNGRFVKKGYDASSPSLAPKSEVESTPVSHNLLSFFRKDEALISSVTTASFTAPPI